MRTTSKRRPRLVLAATAAAVLLASACSGGSSGDSAASKDTGPVKLRYWDMQWGSDAFQNQIKANVAEFNKTHPNIQVQFQQLSWGDYSQKLLSAVQAGNPPDMSGGDSGIPFTMAAQDQALDISDLFKKWQSDGTFADMPEWAYKKFEFNGKDVGITWQFDQRAIYYRKDLFAKAGIPLPKTWDDLMAAAKKLNNSSKGMIGIAVPGKQGTYDTDQFYMTLVFQAGGSLADANGKPAINSPQQLTALKFEKDLVSCCAAKGTASWTFTEVLKQFEQGKAAMAFGAGFFANDITKNAKKLAPNVGVLPVLEGPGGPQARHSVSFANPWMIYKQSKHPAQAKEFLAWMMQKENLRKLYAAEPGGKWPVYKSLLNDPIYQSNDMIKALARQSVETGVDYWYPSNKGGVGIASLGTGMADTAINPVITGQRTPEDALKDADKKLAPLFQTK
ncbi:ABC transporter substrate-binding protein [Pedococcus sp. 5OH_020]|uniref:ABC transporter substrate-binding protein n=1 Tax=Pedococcus sp. 5OH_020 TaxID=2989814 RepID=UPI0022E9B514|nr:sugar ABC transporter substrate-binding protein [Pedococcus sp. 5OH_020]